MKSLVIEQSQYSPLIHFDAKTNVFEISGESYSDDSISFFEPVIEWLQLYLQKNKQPIELNFKMNYFNTGTSKRFVMIIKILEDYYKATNVWTEINWYSSPDDDDMLGYAEDFQEYFETIPINVKFRKPQ